METEADILIIGAGAAGLAAARELSNDAIRIIVLEARDRIGGRIYTHRPDDSSTPVELGAEFIHGKHPAILAAARQAGLSLEQVPNRHWYLRRGLLSKDQEFW